MLTTNRRKLPESLLRWARLFTLVFGCLIVALVLRRSMPTWLAITNSVVFSLTFLAGLRLRAATAHVRDVAGKELSWSSGLLCGFGALIVLGVATRSSAWPLVFCAAGFETLVGYAVGKATCFVAGCCNAIPKVGIRVSLPAVEVGVTLLLLVLAAAMAFAFGAMAAIFVMALGHLLTRCASRYFRTGRLRSLLAPDIAVLTIASAATALR